MMMKVISIFTGVPKKREFVGGYGVLGNIGVVKDKLGWERILVVIVVVVGLAARLHEIGYNLVGDEIFSVELESRNFAKVISGSLKDTPHPPLHNVLLHL
jgi:hypothetical protein